MNSKEKDYTIYDIATEADVSIATVSRVLNHPDKVNKKTRKRVESALSKYNYSPSAIARGLVTNTMKTIGIVAPDFGHLPNSSTIHYLENRFFNLEYNSIICNTSYDVEKMKKYFQILAEKKIDGLVLVSSVYSEPEFTEIFSAYFSNIPIVVINGILSVHNAYSILNDNIEAMEQVIAHLLDKGHEDIIFIRNAPSYNALQKQSGFIKAMLSHSLTVNENRIFMTEYSIEGGIDVINRVLESGEKFTAIICADDLTAVSCIKRLKQLGKRIPEDIAVTGYDNTLFSKLCEPALTTVDTKSETLSEIAANTLFDALMNKSVGSPIYVRPELLVRESS